MLPSKPGAPIENLEQAQTRIRELERALDEAIGIILKRDAALEVYERKFRAAGLDPVNPPEAGR